VLLWCLPLVRNELDAPGELWCAATEIFPEWRLRALRLKIVVSHGYPRQEETSSPSTARLYCPWIGLTAASLEEIALP
jgi:hypothetical protein